MPSKQGTITIKGEKLDRIYEHYDNENKIKYIKLKAYSFHDGYKLYKISATYAKQLKPNNYYIVAKSKPEAKQIFKNKYTWLNVISSVSECEKEEVEYIINHPTLYPIS